MNEKITGKLGFNSRNGRYGLLVDDLWEIEGLHCGQCLEWYDYEKGEWIEDRIEGEYPANTPSAWYLDISKLQGRELEGLRVRY